jgi:hypothetical protein
VTTYHSAYAVDDSVAPAPFLVYSAWTDDLFPADEAIRLYLKTRALHPGAEMALHFADLFGHPRADLASGLGSVEERTSQFLARHLKGGGEPLPVVEAYTQACGTAPVEGPFLAADWESLHPGEVRYRSRKARSFGALGADPAVAGALAPLGGGPCRTLPALDDPGAATWRLPPARGEGYTLLGAPTVVADVEVSGSYAQIAARLWDVAPDGSQTLVTHSLHRPRSDAANPQVFQLHPNGWRFAPGHAPKLELLGQSPPSGRAAVGAFSVTVSRLDLRLPVREAAGGDVRPPADPVLPPEADEPGDTGTPVCPAEPREDCTQGSAGELAVAPATLAERDRLSWRWRGPPAEFGDPTATSAFRACVYDAGAALVAELAAPAGGACGPQGKPCWKQRGRGFRRSDPADPAGLRELALTPRAKRAGIALRAQGAALELPALPLALPARAQLLGNQAACWESRFSEPAARNDAGGFLGTAD